jgi:hypothetical protein
MRRRCALLLTFKGYVAGSVCSLSLIKLVRCQREMLLRFYGVTDCRLGGKSANGRSYTSA